MNLNAISREILKATTMLQLAVYEYLDSPDDDTTGSTKIEETGKQISQLVRRLKSRSALSTTVTRST